MTVRTTVLIGACAVCLTACAGTDHATRAFVPPPAPAAAAAPVPSNGSTVAPVPAPLSAVPAPAAAPRVSLRRVTLGQSVQGRTIEMHVFTPVGSSGVPASFGGAVLVIGGIHGNEPTAAVVAERLIEHLRHHPNDMRGQTVAIVPVASPDGRASGSRTNANGVDVNRNFPARNWRRGRPGLYYAGPQPLSEPEARALHRLIESLRPARIVSIHSIQEGRQTNNYDGSAEPLARLMERHNGYPVTASMGYPTPGSLGSWAGIDRKTPLVTLELPRELDGQKAWEQNRDALLAFIAGR